MKTPSVWKPTFTWRWSKNRKCICIGGTLSYWNPKGTKYLGRYYLTINLLNLQWVWTIPESINIKDII